MTISHVLAPNPFWSIIDNVGLLAGGAKLYTRSSRNPSQDKAAYQDAAGTIPYTNPIIFDLNGTKPPIYWRLNSDDAGDLYYIFAEDADGTLLWTVNVWPQGAGGGGGTIIITNNISLRNYIANGVLIENTGDTAMPIPDAHTKIAPSNHKGFTPAESNPIVSSTTGIMAPDIWFTKSNTNANDQITFPVFPLGTQFINDVCPDFYVRYVCTNMPLNETYKCFQFPITQKVQNLSNQIVTFQFWAKVETTPVDVEVFVKQYYGSAPGATPTTRGPAAGTVSLSTAWQQFNVSFTVPTVGAATLGPVGSQTDDDALYIQLEMPRGVACDISFTKVALRLGNVTSTTADFETYDELETIAQSPRTGDIRLGYSANPPPGWVACNDGVADPNESSSIGNVGTNATRHNKDTFQLYATLYTNVSDTYAKVVGGRTGTTVGDAVTDFIANKKMLLMPTLGRAIGAAGAGNGLTVRALGQFLGSETISINDAPLHNHGPLAPTTNFFGQVGGGPSFAPPLGNGFDTAPTTDSRGGGTGSILNVQGQTGGKMPPMAYMNAYIKL